MNLETMQTIIRDSQKRPVPEFTRRDLGLKFIKNMSLSVVGARRCGKTFLTFQHIKGLIDQGMPVENICRIQFNDLRLSLLRAPDLMLIDQAYYALYPEKRQSAPVYFVFEEIHRIDGWEDYVLHLLEEQEHQVLLTGSTSKLLKGDIATSLRGKNFSCELFPFSLREFLRHYKIAEDAISSGGQAHLRKMLARYLRQGGFPGLLDLDDVLHVDLLQTYWDSMVLRDIIEAHPDDNINISSFTHFAQALVSRISCPMTIRGIMNGMTEAGLRFSGETLYKYLRYLEEAFMIYTVPIFAKSEKIRNRNYRKVYAIDWSLADAVAYGEGIGISRKLENLVYLELRRRGYEISYYRIGDEYEIDFIGAPKKQRKQRWELYQVCYTLEAAETRDRELRGIPQACKELKIEKACIITFNEEDTIAMDGISVHIIPAWKWLLEQQPGV